MQLPLFFQGLAKAAPLRAALQAGIVAAAAVAGYVTFLPLSPNSGSARLSVAEAEQPRWAGHIERPALDTSPPSAPITSASYVMPEAGLADNTAKKNPTAGAIIPKVAGKLVLPPRRPTSTDDTVRTAAPAALATPPAAAGAPPVPPAPIPVLVAASETPEKPVSRNMFSPVTDRLPPAGNLLKPFHFVGDTFQNLIKSF